MPGGRQGAGDGVAGVRQGWRTGGTSGRRGRGRDAGATVRGRRDRGAAASEAGSVKQALIADGQFHDYVFAVGDNPRWRGRINSFRFDPCSRAGARVALAGVRLSTDGK